MGLNEKLFSAAAVDNEKSALFNGSSAYIDVNAKIPASLNIGLSFWVKTTTTSDYLFSTKLNYATSGWGVEINGSGKISWFEGNGVNNATSQASSGSVNNGNWNHVVISRYSNGLVSMWINNVRVLAEGNVGTYKFTSTTYAAEMHIGRYAGANILDYNGEMDEVVIYNRGIVTHEVAILYNRTGIPSTPTAYYKFNNNFDDEQGNYDAQGVNMQFGTGI